MKKLLLIFWLIVPVAGLCQNMRKVEFSSEYNKEKEQWTFYADNPNFYPVTMHIEMTSMLNVSSSFGQSADIVLLGNRRTVCYQLTTDNKTMKASWDRKYTLYKGNPYAVHNDDISYFLPVSPGKRTIVKNLTSLNKRLKNTENEESLIAYQFLLEEGDTVFACRKGLVCEIEEDLVEGDDQYISFKRHVNYVLVIQPDQTFAEYRIFKQGDIFVKPGETVYPGTPLGVAGGGNYTNGYQIRFRVYKPVKGTEDNSRNSHYWQYFRPKFIFDQGETGQLEYNEEYTCIHPEELMTTEMSKREKKKWLKKKADGN